MLLYKTSRIILIHIKELFFNFGFGRVNIKFYCMIFSASVEITIYIFSFWHYFSYHIWFKVVSWNVKDLILGLCKLCRDWVASRPSLKIMGEFMQPRDNAFLNVWVNMKSFLPKKTLSTQCGFFFYNALSIFYFY